MCFYINPIFGFWISAVSCAGLLFSCKLKCRVEVHYNSIVCYRRLKGQVNKLKTLTERLNALEDDKYVSDKEANRLKHQVTMFPLCVFH